MNKIKLLYIVIIGLLALNIATLGFFFMHAPERNHRKPQEIIIEKLHFDKNQQEQYESIIHWHKTRIHDLDAKFRNTKENLYHILSQSTVDINKKDSLINVLGIYQKEIEKTHFQHFEEIKKYVIKIRCRIIMS